MQKPREPSSRLARLRRHAGRAPSSKVAGVTICAVVALGCTSPGGGPSPSPSPAAATSSPEPVAASAAPVPPSLVVPSASEQAMP